MTDDSRKEVWAVKERRHNFAPSEQTAKTNRKYLGKSPKGKGGYGFLPCIARLTQNLVEADQQKI
jgi:hypothetical protein